MQKTLLLVVVAGGADIVVSYIISQETLVVAAINYPTLAAKLKGH